MSARAQYTHHKGTQMGNNLGSGMTRLPHHMIRKGGGRSVLRYLRASSSYQRTRSHMASTPRGLSIT